jgi:hypothetical protein
LFRPVAIEGIVEATKRFKFLGAEGCFGNLAKEQAETCSERRAGLETKDAEADRPLTSGRPLLGGKWTTDAPHSSAGAIGVGML